MDAATKLPVSGSRAINSNRLLRILLFATLAGGGAASHSQPVPAPARGELLYSSHCVTCHTTEMHWRDNKQAVDWNSLKEQVRRWQGNAGLMWDEADIVEVSRYLNDTFYRYPRTDGRASRAGPSEWEQSKK